jgi:hypothetical protein
MRHVFALAIALAAASDAWAACPSPVPSSCNAYGPPAQCSNDALVRDPAASGDYAASCTTDASCGFTGAALKKCPNNEDNKPTCVRYPFVDIAFDGCYDYAAGDRAITFPYLRALCEAAYLGSTSGLGLTATITTINGTTRKASSTLTAPSVGNVATVACTFNRANGAHPRSLIRIETDWGFTTPSEMKCLDGTRMLKNQSGMKRDESTIEIIAGGDFRNYAWGAWKNHYPQTRFTVEAQNIILGGFTIPSNPPLFQWEINMNWDKDITLKATGPDGCIKGGPDLPNAGNDDEIRMNGGDAGDFVRLIAAGTVELPAPWAVQASGGAVEVEGCGLCLNGSAFPPGTSFNCCSDCSDFPPATCVAVTQQQSCGVCPAP